ncbi:hypothetical protein OWR29_09305 [Actinoplanes sp. Pm04-4]|uniref:Polysaccharide chain length determinant N-terminal domain-containing protein n=1 Tax=Paractinoplanes pyxinae TaxID=2997416 RepID=A0ABT4AXU5_9ACTN|nr:hypothetical protein [Actinoplanes pyxinae]MCY1138193.1 hypothetical protein [Actinoplanes pyxinae]
MDFWDLTKLLFRRWYISGPLLLLTVAGTLMAAKRIEPDYVATSYVQLVPPAVTPALTESKAPQPKNPWLDLGVSSLGKAAMLTVQDQKVVEVLDKAGYSDDFTLELDQSLPIVTFEVIGHTEQQASTTTKELIKRFESSVRALQNEYGAPKNQLVTIRQLDLGDNVTESTSKVKRALVAIGGIGLLLTVALTIAFDALMRRRKPATPPEAPAVAETPVADPVVPPLNGHAVVNRQQPDVPRPRSTSAEETQAIVIGEDRTVRLRPTSRTPDDKR